MILIGALTEGSPGQTEAAARSAASSNFECLQPQPVAPSDLQNSYFILGTVI